MSDTQAVNRLGQPLTDQNGQPIYQDASGRQYAIVGGQKVYTQPIGLTAGGSTAYDPTQVDHYADNGGLIHTPETWNFATGQYDPGGIDWGALGSYLGLGAIGGAAGAAAFAGGGAGAAAGSGAASAGSTIPATTISPVGGLVTGAAPSVAAGTGTAAGVGTGGTALSTAAKVMGMTSGTGQVISSGIGAATQLYGAKKQADAANNAAGLQSEAAKQALDFAKTQATQEQANFEATQHANYDQYAARENRLSALGAYVGLPARQIPAYVPTTSVLAPTSAPSAVRPIGAYVPARTLPPPTVAPAPALPSPYAPGTLGAYVRY